MTRPQRISYFFIFATLVLAGGLHLATLFLIILFSYFALEKLRFARAKWLSVALFVILVLGISYGFVFFVRQAAKAFPYIADQSVPLVIKFANQHGITLPFDDVESLKTVVIDSLKSEIKYLGNFAKFATKEFAFFLVGIVTAISMFFNASVELRRESQPLKNNLYSVSSDYIAARFQAFYESFKTVIGAQLIISTINTALTSIFVLWTELPYGAFVIILTFLCGLLPIIGNLISNIIVVGIAFTRSPQFALVALAYLIAIHKLEYFLNSKIIGDRIKNPMWLTLLSMILAERLMGIPGLILAPVMLHYLKIETSKIEVAPAPLPVTGPAAAEDPENLPPR